MTLIELADLFALSVASSNMGEGNFPECHFELMIGNLDLQNDLIDNRERLFANTNFLIQHELAQLEQI